MLPLLLLVWLLPPLLLCGLSGTPLQNNMVELYGLLAFMYPDVFTTPGPFEAAFNLVKGQVSDNMIHNVRVKGNICVT